MYYLTMMDVTYMSFVTSPGVIQKLVVNIKTIQRVNELTTTQIINVNRVKL